MDKPADRMMAALGCPGLTGNEARVLAVIAYHDGEGGAWPSYERITGLLTLRRSAVGAALKGLREKGVLTVSHERRGRSTVNVYRIHRPENVDGERHRPSFPDGEAVSPSGKLDFHRPGNPDTNWKEQEGLSKEESLCPCGLTLTVATSTCPACGLERPLASPWRGAAA